MAGETDPVPPFEASVPAVIALLPHATFPTSLAVGQRAVTQGMIRQYVEDVTAAVQLRIEGWERLRDDLQPLVIAAARNVVHQGAAAYTQDARFPEKSAKSADSYAEVLRDRYVRDLADLEAKVRGWLADESQAVDDGGGQGIGFTFPAPSILDTTGF